MERRFRDMAEKLLYQGLVGGVVWAGERPRNDFEVMRPNETAIWPVEGVPLLVRDSREVMVDYFRQCLREGMNTEWDLADWQVWHILSERVPAQLRVTETRGLLEVQLGDTTAQSTLMGIVGVILGGGEGMIGQVEGVGGVVAGFTVR